MTTIRKYTIAPVNTPCSHYSGCLAPNRANAIHVMVEACYRIPAGSALCGYHSPYDVTPADIDAQSATPEIQRWEVTLTPVDRKNERVVHTFTWAPVRSQAYTRIADMFEKDRAVWAGWNFTVALYPTVLN